MCIVLLQKQKLLLDFVNISQEQCITKKTLGFDNISVGS